MREERISFYSEGVLMAGIMRLPDASDGPCPAIVQGPGWLGLKDANLYLRYHNALTEAGFAVLIFDYRGFGDSEGRNDILLPAMQLEDLINAVTYLTTRDDVDADNIGAFGSGGTGGGNSIMLAAHDSRVSCVVSQVPCADGEDWLHRMRSEYEWLDFKASLEADRKQRVLTGEGKKVHPREGIMIPTAERKKTTIKKDVDGRIPSEVLLRSAEAILEYRPIDVVHKVPALLVIGVEGDATTPTDHAIALYEEANEPKKLIMQRHTTHYAAYETYGDQVTPAIVEWFQTHMNRGNLDIQSEQS
jgi:dipeptidyl aminopeptidase/acylaminoacyl peptidase